MAVVRVELGERAYDVVIDDAGYAGLGERLGARRRVLVVDDALPQQWIDEAAAALAVEPMRFAVSESAKTVDTWSRMVDALLAAGVDRRTVVCALGGGVLGDIAGFAAASTQRGLPFVQLPTTLLAMVDSSVGGKTAVNHASGKNLIGAFHQPDLVWASLPVLQTLPPRELAAGLAEAVKTGLVGDAELLSALEAGAHRSPDGLADVVARCVRVKAAVVAADERESGWRGVLNAGHTVGHAYEAVLGYGTLLHGEAVSIGLVAETAWALREGHCRAPQLAERLTALLASLALPVEAPGASVEALVAAMRRDKKGRGKSVSIPVPADIADMMFVQQPFDRLEDLLP